MIQAFIKKITLSCILFAAVFICKNSNAQSLIPYRNDVVTHKIWAAVITESMVQNEKISKKKYVDTVKFDMYGTLLEKRITGYDTDSKRQYAGVWTYTYDSVGNRKLETRKSPDQVVMDYYTYVYDSNRIKKQIWVYWMNMKHQFDRIYEVKYDGYGRIKTEIMEDGMQKIDTVLSFHFDTLNHLNNILCTRDKDLKDTINVLSYFYNPDGSTAKTVTASKSGKTTEEFTYDVNKKVVKKSSDDETTSYVYDKNGMLSEMDVMQKSKKGIKYKYTVSYISR